MSVICPGRVHLILPRVFQRGPEGVDRAVFKSRWLPYVLVLPQVVVTIIFFVWPSANSLRLSLFRVSPFTGDLQYVGLLNFVRLLSSPEYHRSIIKTIIFTLGVTASSMLLSLAVAVLANQRIGGLPYYRTALLWPYGIAAPVAGIIWLFIFHPAYGVLPYGLSLLLGPVDLNWLLDEHIAMLLVIAAATWSHLGYNVAFFLAGLQQVPSDILEAASVDGATSWRRFWAVTFPLLSPVTFFLLVMNVTYSLFDTFGVINAVTRGGPGDATSILVFKAYQDGIRNLNLGSSAAQSVILMLFSVLLTTLQFRYTEKRVTY